VVTLNDYYICGDCHIREELSSDSLISLDTDCVVWGLEGWNVNMQQ